MAAFEPRDELEALEEGEVGDGAVAERLRFADVVGDGVFAVLPREENGAEVDWCAIGFAETGGCREGVGLGGWACEEEVGGGGEGDGGCGVWGVWGVGEGWGGGGSDGETEEGERVCMSWVRHCSARFGAEEGSCWW